MNRNRYCIVGLGIGLVLAGAGLPGSAAPTPSMHPTTWELEIEFHDPARITLTLPGETRPTTYWYLLYTVTNRSGQDVKFYPSFELVTDTFQIIHSGDKISPRVVDAVQARHKKMYPFFVGPLDVTGPLLQGEDNARTSAAIFRNPDVGASRFTIYVGGLSGEFFRLENPVFDPKKPQSEANSPFFTLRKTLAIAYDLPGDSQTRRLATPARATKKWVMR